MSRKTFAITAMKHMEKPEVCPTAANCGKTINR
jgi:hypothetical protein